MRSAQSPAHVIFPSHPRSDAIRASTALVCVDPSRVQLVVLMLGHPDVMIGKLGTLDKLKRQAVQAMDAEVKLRLNSHAPR